MKKLSYLLSSLFFVYNLFTLQLVYAEAETAPQNIIEQIGGAIGGAINNVSTTAVIVGKYSVDPLLGPFQIDVSSENGVVTLKGNVDSNTQYDRAIKLAKETQDVKSVNASELTITPSESPVSDTFTTFKVKMLLFKNSLFGGQDYNAWDIHVETNNGVVYLVGDVKSNTARDQIVAAVRSVEGVKNILADLRVNS